MTIILRYETNWNFVFTVDNNLFAKLNLKYHKNIFLFFKATKITGQYPTRRNTQQSSKVKKAFFFFNWLTYLAYDIETDMMWRMTWFVLKVLKHTRQSTVFVNHVSSA